MVKQGYKQTEIGVIPENWEVKELGEVLTFGSGRDYKHLKSGEIPVYGTGGIMTFVNDFLYQGESVGIGRKGTIDKPVYLTGKFWTVDTLFYTHNFKDILPKYTFYQFGRIPWKEYNEASGVPSLNKNTLANIQIPFPPLPEQEAIAAALSDADAWIESLEQLIAKKRLIKQGAMQTLLTPKDDWEVKKLGDYVKFQTGFPFSSEFFNTKMIGERLIKNRDLRSDDSIFYYSGVFKKDFIVNNGDLLIGMDGDFEPVLWKKGKALLNQRVGRVLKLKEISIPYLVYSLIDKLKEIEESTGSTTVKHLSHSDIENLEYKIPSLSEQERIARILSDMDAELEALEQQLAKARQIKQGMMQELLTGRIRLEL